MNRSTFISSAYLKRLQIEAKITTSIEGMHRLHNAQHQNIPFENFDIALNRKINLTPEALFDKLVYHKRGGYCHELNLLLRMAFEYYGFELRPLLARVHVVRTTGRGHLIHLVKVEGQEWLIDVGFGAETPSNPLPFILDTEIKTKHQCFKFVEDELYGIMLQSKKEHGWINLYSFDFCYVCDADIEYANHCTETSPHSFFTSARVATIPIENGYRSLLNNTIKTQIHDKIETLELQEDNTYFEALEKYFGIEIQASYEDFKYLKQA